MPEVIKPPCTVTPDAACAGGQSEETSPEAHQVYRWSVRLITLDCPPITWWSGGDRWWLPNLLDHNFLNIILYCHLYLCSGGYYTQHWDFDFYCFFNKVTVFIWRCPIDGFFTFVMDFWTSSTTWARNRFLDLIPLTFMGFWGCSTFPFLSYIMFVCPEIHLSIFFSENMGLIKSCANIMWHSCLLFILQGLCFHKICICRGSSNL